MELNKYIDHTNLKQDMSKKDLIKLCEEAKEYNFKSICINPAFIKEAKELLKGSDVLVCTVIGFPLGANSTETKVFETKDAILKGADEIDMVINISKLKDKEYEYVENEIKEIVNAANGKVVKVIIETCLLTEEEKIKACKIINNTKASFIKTSTGFSTNGAIVEDIELFKKEIDGNIEIKAAGGVRTKEDTLKMIEAGATRIGTSGGVKIVNDEEHDSGY